MFCWILVSLRGVSTPPGAGGIPGLRFVRPQLILSDPRAKIFMFSSLPSGISPGFFQQKPRDAFVGPRGARGRRVLPLVPRLCSRGMFLAGKRECGGLGTRSGWEAVPTPGAERPCSAPCCAHAPAPGGTVPPLRQIRSFPVGIEVVKAEGRAAAWTRGKLFLLGCFPSRRVKNPAEAHPG